MPRHITTIALSQLGIIVLGYFALRFVMRINGYGMGPEWDYLNWTTLALGLRKFGLFLLIVPGAWTIGSVRAFRNPNARPSFTIWLVIGTVLALVLVAAFLYATANSFTRPLFFWR